MKWNNLKNNKCPQCGKKFTLDCYRTPNSIGCPCGFKITEQRYKEITSEMTSQKIEKEI